MRVVAIIQARIGSSRLNGKVLKPLGESSVLEYLIARLSKSSTIDEIIVASSTEEKDYEIYNLFKDTD